MQKLYSYMEHAEYIAESVSYTKDTFLHIDGLFTWIKLFLAVLIPFFAGFGIASLLLQIIIKPLLVSILVVPTLGFTEDGISYMLQYAAVLSGFAFLFLFPYYQGFLYQSMSSRSIPTKWTLRGLFFAGWKINALIIYYMIPLVVLFLLYAVLFSYTNGALDAILTGDVSSITAFIDYISLMIYLILEFVTAIFLSLFACIGMVHLASTGSLKKAVNMREVADVIKRIGWYDYILCIVIITIILLIVLVIFLGFAELFAYNPVVNSILFSLLLFVTIPGGIFITRYLANVYETAFAEPEDDLEEFDDF